MNEDEVMCHNAKLVQDDNTEIVCESHHITRRWGDLDSITQLAILNGWDVEGDVCVME